MHKNMTYRVEKFFADDSVEVIARGLSHDAAWDIANANRCQPDEFPYMTHVVVEPTQTEKVD